MSPDAWSQAPVHMPRDRNLGTLGHFTAKSRPQVEFRCLQSLGEAEWRFRESYWALILGFGHLEWLGAKVHFLYVAPCCF